MSYEIPDPGPSGVVNAITVELLTNPDEGETNEYRQYRVEKLCTLLRLLDTSQVELSIGADILLQRNMLHRYGIELPVTEPLPVDATLAHLRRKPRTTKAIDVNVTEGSCTQNPPLSAQFILLLVPKRVREHLAGDLEEEYKTILLPQYGRRWANFWYWCQVLSSTAAFAGSGLRKFASIEWLWKFMRR